MTRALTRFLMMMALIAGSIGIASAQRYRDPVCPPGDVSWTEQNIKQCIDDATKAVDQSPAGSEERAYLLAKRAALHERLGLFKQSPSPIVSGKEFDDAIADYGAALLLAPKADSIRYDPAQLLIRMNRGAEALSDATALIDQMPDSIKYRVVKGEALSSLERHHEAINAYTEAIPFAQSCAEASMIQELVNKYRHAFDPPMTREEALQAIKSKRTQLYDKPETSVTAIGFACSPSTTNSFDDLVTYKQNVFMHRGRSYRAVGNLAAARTDFEYARSLSSIPEFQSIELCDLDIDLKDDYSAVETCRTAFDSNVYAMLSNADQAAKIGKFLLEDGDLKGACRIAFPFIEGGMKEYLSNPKIKDLQRRVKAALKGAGLKSCEKLRT